MISSFRPVKSIYTNLELIHAYGSINSYIILTMLVKLYPGHWLTRVHCTITDDSIFLFRVVPVLFAEPNFAGGFPDFPKDVVARQK